MALHSRRAFLKNGSSLAAATLLAPMTRAFPAMNAHDAPLIGIQIGPESFVDEGVEALLSWLQEKAGVNTICLTTFTYGQGFAGRQPSGRFYPGHGALASAGAPFHGGHFATLHDRYYTNTVLSNTRAPDLGGRDILAEVLPAARKRGMKVFCGIEDRWDRAFDVPGLQECAETDLRGRSTFDRARSATTCVLNPNVRAFWTALTTDLCSSYPIDGLLFENERSGPLMNVLGASPFRKGVGDTSHVACFCPFHRKVAKEKGIDFERAKQGYEKLVAYVQQAVANQRPPDGYYVTFQQILHDYSEIAAYDRLCDEGKLQIVADIHTTSKAIRKESRFIFHVEQTISFNPFNRVALDYEHLWDKAEFLKPATYNNCAGERYANLIHNLNATIYRDLPPDELYSMLNHLLGYSGLASLDALPAAGLPADYVFRETKRAMAKVQDRCGILAGIDVNVPVAAASRQTTPEDTYAATLAALQAGAQGVVLSRKYAEMRRENLEGAGRAIAQWKGQA